MRRMERIRPGVPGEGAVAVHREAKLVGGVYEDSEEGEAEQQAQRGEGVGEVDDDPGVALLRADAGPGSGLGLGRRAHVAGFASRSYPAALVTSTSSISPGRKSRPRA